MSAFHAGHTFSENRTYIYIYICKKDKIKIDYDSSADESNEILKKSSYIYIYMSSSH